LYKLIDKNGIEQELKADCYTEALVVALAKTGSRVEAFDDPSVPKPVVTKPCEMCGKATENGKDYQGCCSEKCCEELFAIPEPLEVKVNYTGKTLEVYELLKASPQTATELIVKTGLAQSTVKQLLTYKFKNDGIVVDAHVVPGNMEASYLIN